MSSVKRVFPYNFQCPVCGSEPDNRCIGRGGRELVIPHKPRTELARPAKPAETFPYAFSTGQRVFYRDEGTSEQGVVISRVEHVHPTKKTVAYSYGVRWDDGEADEFWEGQLGAV